MQFFKPPLRAVAAPPQTMQGFTPPRLDAAAALFGGRTTIAVAVNFQLHGVIAAGNPTEGVAILAAGGKPAQAIRVNTEVMPGVMVKEVHPQYVLLSERGVVKRVDLPEIAKAQGGAGNPAGAVNPVGVSNATGVGTTAGTGTVLRGRRARANIRESSDEE